ncbi:hypothetical protein BDV36DRAFT_276323, partial [Aspergillus pseudocaelatus]
MESCRRTSEDFSPDAMQYAPYSTVRHMIRIFFLLLPLRTIIPPPPFLAFSPSPSPSLLPPLRDFLFS